MVTPVKELTKLQQEQSINHTNTRTNKKKSERGEKKENQEVTHCPANANPEMLALRMKQQSHWLSDEHIDHA